MRTLQGLLTKPQDDPAWNNPTLARQVYSVVLWGAVKLWELNQEFGLEGMPQAAFGSKAESRAWYAGHIFNVSPNISHIPPGSPGLGNGKPVIFGYFSMMWYQLQLILNDGNGSFRGNNPLDFPYVYNFIGGMSRSGPGAPGSAGLMIEWLAKGLQASEFGPGPEIGSGGWQLGVNDASVLATYPNSPSIWSGFSPSQRQAMTNGYLALWLAKVKTFTAQQFYSGTWASPADVIDAGQPQGPFGDRFANMIGGYSALGADQNLLSQIAGWAQTVWPSFNWSSLLNKTCTFGSQGWAVCQ